MQMTSTMASSVTCRAACQGKERKTHSCFPLTDSQSRQLSVCIWDWLTALLLSCSFLQIHSPLKHRENRKWKETRKRELSISVASCCSWKHQNMDTETIGWKMFHYSKLCITQKHCSHSKTQPGQMSRLTASLIPSVGQFLTLWLFHKYPSKIRLLCIQLLHCLQNTF